MSRAPAGSPRAGRRERLASALFPPPPPSDPRLTGARAVLAFLGLVLSASALVLMRLGPGVFERVWAEDGPVYLAGAIGHDFWFAVFKPYAGYLVVVPRLIGAVAGTLVPLRWAATVIVVLAAVLNALSGVAVWFGAAGQVPDRRLRGALVLATVLAAAAGQETLDSAAYAPWFMLFGTFWLLFLWPRTALGTGAAAAFVLLTGLSTPGVWFFLPVALLRALAGPSRKAWIVLAAFAAAAAAQVPVVLGQEQEPAFWTGHIVVAYLQRVVDGGLLGQRIGGNLWSNLGWPFLIAFTLAVIAGFVLLLRRAPRGAIWCALALVGTSLLMFLVSVYQRTVGNEIYWPGGMKNGLASRYVVVPALLLLSAAVVAVGGALRGGWGRSLSPRRADRAAWAAVAAVVLVVAVSFDMSYSANGVPKWRDAITQAADRCLAEGNPVGGIATEPVPYGVIVKCGELESFASTPRRGRRR